MIVSVTEGDDIILKHPMIFKTAELAIINKVDIAHAVDVNAEKMREDILSYPLQVKRKTLIFN